MNLIEAAVMPLKVDAMDHAEKFARASIAKMTEKLAANAFNLNAVAPHPKSWGMNRNEYKIAKGKRAAFEQFTAHIDQNHLPYLQREEYDGAVYTVEVDPAAIERVVKATRKNAAAQYDAYVAKLESKVADDGLKVMAGPIAKATLKGSHVWGSSLLTIETDTGYVSVWHTQMILNRSVHGLLFNQFPTRKVKA